MVAKEDGFYQALARALYLAAGLFLLFWFLDAITTVLLFFAFALIVALALNPPVTWLERKGLPRVVATLLVSAAVAAAAGLLLWFAVPELVTQASALWEQLPGYLTALADRLSDRLAEYPELQRRLRPDGQVFTQLLPSLQAALVRVGRYSLSTLGLAIFGILLVTTAIYTLARPRPLIKGYLSLMPSHLRDPAARALARGSQMVSGWIWSNVIVGGVEGVAVTLFLSFMGVPGALLWGVVAFFAELVPKLGPYLMSIPPILVALALDPMKALWVLLFFIVLQEITGDVIAPMVRSSQMNLHPVSLLFAVLAMGSAFGILGALIATPIAGFAKAFYEEFYLARQPKDSRLDERVEDVLDRRSEPEPAGQGPPKERPPLRRRREMDRAPE